jgi:serine-type D-Ala-D-Ala carboxypeptidase (penicillin-binding protein 5/6)
VRGRLIAAFVAALILAPAAHASVPKVDARAFLVEDATTGAVLAQRAADERLPIASITKLMTVLITLRHVKTTDVVTVEQDAADVGESTIHLRAGERMSVGDLLKAALIQSANDAADALADDVTHGSRTAFVAMMNAQARKLGLRNTHYARPDGLDAASHYSSARDVTKLAQRVMRNPVVRRIVGMRSAVISGGRHLHTWNDLLGVFRGLDGVKTGHTATAGWCEVAEVKRDGLDVYATVLGSPTRGQRNADLAALLRWGLSVERPVWVIAPDRVYASAATGYGLAGVPLVAARGVVRPVRVDRPLVEKIVATSAVSLPVRRGAVLGQVRVLSGRRVVAREPLVAARSVSRPGVVSRVRFYARRTFTHIGGWFT